MAVYQIAPSPSLGIPEISFASWRDGFTEEEIDKIVSIGDSLTIKSASVGPDSKVEEAVRSSKIGWINLTPETNFIYDRIAFIARQLNGEFFNLDIWGFVEDFQYTIYDGKDDHYTWHLDRGGNATNAPRKLSLVIQLSDPSEYEGGDLEIFDAPVPTQVTKQKGLVVAFPSFILHRVTPVTKGIRKTLVVWLAGPQFK
jgi:PKHD-type hydroxylase